MTTVPHKKNNSKIIARTGCLTTDNILEDILSKKPQNIKEEDVHLIQGEAFMSRNHSLNTIIQKYYEDLYGTKPAPQDEFGKSYVREPSGERKSYALNSFFINLQNIFGRKKYEHDDEDEYDEEDDYDDEYDEDENSDAGISSREYEGEEKFIWQGDGCDNCSQYDGQEFAIEEIPNTHPNCKCEVVSTQDPQKIIKPTFDSDKYHKEKEEKQMESQEISEADKILLDMVRENLKDEEDIKPHIYLDTKGIKTTGIGANIDSKEKFMKANWQVDGRPATHEEKETAFKIFEEAKQKGEFGKKFDADYYENKSNLRITEKEAKRLRDEHLKKDLKEIKKEVPGFDELPIELKEVLMDIKYNTGNVKDDKKGWPKLHDAIRRKSIQDASKNVNRPDVSQKRNDWAKNKILSIKKW